MHILPTTFTSSSRVNGKTALCVQVGDVSSYVRIMNQIFSNAKEKQLDDDDVQSRYAGFNSVITPPRQRMAEQADKLLRNKVPTRYDFFFDARHVTTSKQ